MLIVIITDLCSCIITQKIIEKLKINNFIQKYYIVPTVVENKGFHHKTKTFHFSDSKNMFC